MLDVAYEAVEDLPPGKLADINEGRGRIRVRLDRTQPLTDVVRQLNIEIDHLMASSHWFQLWKTEIVGRDTPGCPLQVEYIFRPWVPPELGVCVAEDRGAVRVYVCPQQETERFAVAMNEAVRDLLAGGQWFQLYAGEIIDNSPEPAHRA